MKFILGLILLAVVTICMTGCTYQEIIDDNRNNMVVCIDGIEYYMFSESYHGYMAPRLQADENNNPKVVRCGSNK